MERGGIGNCAGIPVPICPTVCVLSVHSWCTVWRQLCCSQSQRSSHHEVGKRGVLAGPAFAHGSAQHMGDIHCVGAGYGTNSSTTLRAVTHARRHVRIRTPEARCCSVEMCLDVKTKEAHYNAKNTHNNQILRSFMAPNLAYPGGNGLRDGAVWLRHDRHDNE